MATYRPSFWNRPLTDRSGFAIGFVIGVLGGFGIALVGGALLFLILAAAGQVLTTLTHIRQPLGRTPTQKSASGTFLGIITVQLLFILLVFLKII